jgi:hypothetical protein
MAKSKPNLTIIQGGLHCKMAYGALQIVAAPASAPPFQAGAIAFEEDTFLKDINGNVDLGDNG